MLRYQYCDLALHKEHLRVMRKSNLLRQEGS
jgi:hypothetical protein